MFMSGHMLCLEVVQNLELLVNWAPRICLFGWIVLEVFFWILSNLSWLRSIDQLTTPPAYREDPEQLMERILMLMSMKTFNVTDFLRGWFFGAPLTSIRRGNAEEFFAWAMFAKKKESLLEAEVAAVARFIDTLSVDHGIDFKPGMDPDMKCVKFTLEPMSRHVTHRPLLFYVGLRIIQVAASFLLTQAGCIHYHVNGLSYWYRPSPQPNPTCQAMPNVFFHGINPGLFMYLKLLRTMSSGRSTMIVDIPCISMSLDMTPPPTRQSLVTSMRLIMAKHGIEKACISGHSYGTFFVTWMVQDAADLVAQVVLIDPLCFLQMPALACNVMYEQFPSDWTDFSTRLLKSGTREIGVAKALRRHFWWYDSLLWAEDLDGIPTVVHLASRDMVCPTGLIREYLNSWVERRLQTKKSVPSIDVVWSEGLGHMEVLFSTNQQSELARAMFLQECRILAGDEKKPPPRGLEVKRRSFSDF